MLVRVLFILSGILLIIFQIRHLRLFLGLMPKVRAIPLNKEQKNRIKKYGLSHCTTSKGYEGIERDKCIRMSKGEQTYSNQYRPCVFFCINDGEGAVEGVNKNTKYSKKIIIKSITDEQLDEMKIRRCDEAVHYLKDFNLNDMEYEWEDVVVEKNSIGFILKGIFNMKDEYTKAFWIAVIPLLLSIIFYVFIIYVGFSILK